MHTIRRIYLYTVSFVSLEVVLWGLINLARSFLSGEEIGGVERLAGALSFMLVGLPVFLIHWWLAQRSARQDEEERSSRVRAVFFYGVLFAELSPLIQNGLAILNRFLFLAFNLRQEMALVGGEQSWSDNLTAIAFNALVVLYFWFLLRREWQAGFDGDSFAEVRRFYRYAWVVYALVLTVMGFQQVTYYILGFLNTVGPGVSELLVNGLTLLLVGSPLWALTWRHVQLHMDQAGERRSELRLVLLYVFSLPSLIVVLAAAAFLLSVLLEVLFGARFTLDQFFSRISNSVSVALPIGLMGFYYNRILFGEIGAVPEISRGNSLRRIYAYLLALSGLAAWFAGLQFLFSAGVRLLLGETTLAESALRSSLAASLATLVIGLPVWFAAWRPMQRQAYQAGEIGDRARSSIIRRTYLFLAVFAGVIGSMLSAGGLLFQIISSLLGETITDLNRQVLDLSKTLVLFVFLLVYHLFVLRGDRRRAAQALTDKHAEYPVLVMAMDEGSFVDQMLAALQREVPNLPIAIHLAERGAPDEIMATARAVILPGSLVARPTEAMRLWLQGFDGPRIVVPVSEDDGQPQGWYFMSSTGRSLRSLTRQAAQAVRSLAEGEPVPVPRDISPAMIVGLIAAALVIIPIVFALIGLVVSTFQG